jgi:hypothetical protein
MMAELQNKPADVPRDRNGRVLPGHTANPGGRPKVWREFREAMRERSPEALAIIDQALSSGDPELSRWAAEKVLAYAWGRPPQRVQVGADEDAPPLLGERRFDTSGSVGTGFGIMAWPGGTSGKSACRDDGRIRCGP